MSDGLNIWRPYTQAAVDPLPIFIDRAEGAFLYARDGRRLIDATSSWWVNVHGHSHPAIAEAIAAQSRRMQHVIFAGCTHEPAEELAIRLKKILPAPLSQLFLSDNGSTAVEVALKMAIQYWKNCGQPQRTKIVALEHAYHGDTAGAMSVSDDSIFTDPFQSMRFPVLRAHSAYCHRCPVGKIRQTCNIDCIDSVAAILERHHHEIAAIIVEPLIQGAGGMIIHPIGFLQRIRRLATDYGVLLIADEVFTGFGRTGAMFACDLAKIVPDMMCLSKGLTGGSMALSATVCTEEIYNAFLSPERSRAFFHGHSYTGNPIACAAANASLQVFESEPVLARVKAIEMIHAERLTKLARHSKVEAVRWLGDVGALELKAGDAGYLSSMRNRLYDFFIDRGVLLRPLGNVLYVLPPYVIAAADLHYVYDVIEEAVA